MTTSPTSLQDTFEKIVKQSDAAKQKSESRMVGAAINNPPNGNSALAASVCERTDRTVGITVKICDLIGKVGKGIKSLDAGEKLITVTSVLGSAPMIGVAFEALLPVVEAFNESKKIEPKMLRLLERVGDLLGDLEEEFRNALTGVSDVSKVKNEISFFCNIVTEVVEIEKRRSGSLKFVKALWFASGNSKKLEKVEADIDNHIQDVTYKILRYLRNNVESESEWAKVKSNRPNAETLYGRADVLARLESTLTGSGGRLALLVGSAGVGKTACAKEFARSFSSGTKERFVLWIEAASESNRRLDFFKFLNQFKSNLIDDPNTDESTLATHVWRTLEKCPFEWLVVFNNAPITLDDVDTPNGFLSMFCPSSEQPWNNGRILFTSRSNTYGGKTSLGYIAPIQLTMLSEKDALEMFLECGADSNGNLELATENEEAARELVREHLFGLPLAIATASKHALREGHGIKGYLEKLKKRGAPGVVDAVDGVLEMSLDYAFEQGLGDALDIAAFVNPDRIPAILFGDDPSSMENVGDLVALSLLQYKGNEMYAIHRLHQKAAQKACKTQFWRANERADVVLSQSNQFIPSSWELSINMIPHVESLVSHRQLSDCSLMRRQAGCLRKCGDVLQYAVLDLRGALSKYEAALVLAKETSSRSKDIACIINSIGQVQFALGDRQGAKSKFQVALDMLQDVDENDDASVAIMLHSTGSAYHDQGDYPEALDRYWAALDRKWKMFVGIRVANRDESIAIAKLLARALSLGTTHSMMSDGGPMKLMVQNCGPEHAASLDVYWDSLGLKMKPNDAILNTCDDKFEWNDAALSVASTLHNIGAVYRAQELFDQAQQTLEGALCIKQKVLGLNGKYDAIAATLAELGALQQCHGQFDAAKDAFEEVLETYLETHRARSKSRLIASAHGNLAISFHELGSYEDAEHHYDCALAMYQDNNVFGANSSASCIVTTLHNMGKLNYDRKRYGEARCFFEEAVTRGCSSRDLSNSSKARTLQLLGDTFLSLGDARAAQLHYKRSMEMYQSARPPNKCMRANILMTLQRLIETCWQLGDNLDVGLYLKQMEEYGGRRNDCTFRFRGFRSSIETVAVWIFLVLFVGTILACPLLQESLQVEGSLLTC